MTKAEIEKRMSEIQQELDALKEQLNKPEKKTGWEKPEKDLSYWYISGGGQVGRFTWRTDDMDNDLYATGNCFASKEFAENIARYQYLDLRIRRRIAEVCEPVDWKNYSQTKFTIYYDHVENRCCVTSLSYMHKGQWFCDTKAHTEQIIEEFKDDLLWYFAEFKDRMDG